MAPPPSSAHLRFLTGEKLLVSFSRHHGKKTSLVLIFSVKLGNHQFLMAINALDAILSIHLLPLAKI
jgi:hypothetical protein